MFPGRAPDGHVLLTAFVGGARNPDLANADLNTLTARILDDFRPLLGVRGEPTFRAFQLWPRAIPQYTLSHGRFQEIMDDVERRNPGFALAGSFREGVALGDVAHLGGRYRGAHRDSGGRRTVGRAHHEARDEAFESVPGQQRSRFGRRLGSGSCSKLREA